MTTSMPALPPYLTASRSASTNRRMLGPASPPQHGSYSDDNGDNIDSMHLAVEYQKSAEVDGVKQLSDQEEKRWKGIEKALKRNEWILEPLSSAELVGQSRPGKGLSVFSVYSKCNAQSVQHSNMRSISTALRKDCLMINHESPTHELDCC
ncbi:hypothetical protein L218DRAFT_713523 [Marasmius fiardii PR-910]|nr:hypothetical protein L218DRAFT_713523 [Marasmius fiardii PR-910]